MPYSDKYELSDEEFTMQLGFLPGIRKIPGQEHGLGFKEYFKKYEGEKREQAKEWFGNLFGVTDRGSFIEFFQTNRCCNISRFASINGVITAGINRVKLFGSLAELFKIVVCTDKPEPQLVAPMHPKGKDGLGE